MESVERVFKFYDTDITGTQEYDISGKDYELLINACCKYSTVLSLMITDCSAELLGDLQRFRIEKPQNISFQSKHYDKDSITVQYYRVCSELRELLIRSAESIFSWISGWSFCNPEDPTFYREDGSVFFTSIIHEGECTLYVKNEDVSEIISNKLWREKNTGHVL